MTTQNTQSENTNTNTNTNTGTPTSMYTAKATVATTTIATPTTPIKNPADVNSTQVQDMYKNVSTPILIMGKSGRGKTTSLRNLDPNTTFIIQCINKGLPFMNAGAFIDGKNKAHIIEGNKLIDVIGQIDKKLPYVKTLIIDDIQNIMAEFFVEKAMVRGYDKYTELASMFWKIINRGIKCRPDLQVVFLGHEDSEEDGTRKLKTMGRLIDKLGVEGLFTIVLIAETYRVNKITAYYFATQSDGLTAAKSPMGMFNLNISNDLNKVIQRIEEYYKGVKLSESKINFEFEEGEM